jgi:hypothetical protein
MPRFAGAPVLATIAFILACSRPNARPAALHGPLAALIPSSRLSLPCDSVARQYTVPFWRAPYRSCPDGLGGRFEVDADSVVTEVYATWSVPAGERTVAFAAAESVLAARFGPGVRCGPTFMNWRTSDSARVVLLMQPTTDVGGPETDRRPWQITRIARLGPLLDAFWCRQAREQLGA